MPASTASAVHEVPLRRTGSMGDIPAVATKMVNPVPLSYRHSDSFANDIDRGLSSSSTAASQLVLPSLHVSPFIAPALRSPSPSPSPSPPPRQTRTVPVEHAEVHPTGTPAPTGPNTTPQRPRRQSLYVKTVAFLGYGRGSTRTRKELISLIFGISWASLQIVAIVTILALSAHLKSPTSPRLSEWQACDKPLGTWSSIWVVRVCYSWGLGYWNWVRNRQARIRADLESTSSRDEDASPSPNTRNAPSAPSTSHTSSASASGNTSGVVQHSLLYSRLTLLSSLITLTWFLTAHILIYTSINTCRHSAPHLWWLTFSILCVMYIMILEIVILGVVVFVIAPILFLFWNIILICLGRHPLQHPTAIKPEISKLPKSVVDRIPLVMYIPPPPDEATKDGIRVPEAAYTYPPTTPTLPTQKRRFKWWKRDSSSRRGANKVKGEDAYGEKGNGNMNEKTGGDGGETEAVLWEENWEQGEYPFVRLEGNRAACAICLMDFEEPKRLRGVTAGEGKGSEGTSGGDEVIEQVHEVPVETETAEQLKLSDAGSGAQPLRLLACGHVFHKTCLDPWLEKVSGRCPVCQRAVELPQPGQKKAGRRRRQDR